MCSDMDKEALDIQRESGLERIYEKLGSFDIVVTTCDYLTTLFCPLRQFLFGASSNFTICFVLHERDNLRD